MPVRSRRSRRRSDAVAALFELFATGVDWDQEARAIGVATSRYDFPDDMEEVRALWSQYGRAFLEMYDDPVLEPWALREFGEPDAQVNRRAG